MAKVYGPVVNLFKGCRARLLEEQVSAKSIEVFLYHIREIYCSGNDRDYQYLLRWWAWMFQKSRTGVMVLLMSPEKGTGEYVLLELISEHIIGDEYVATTDKIFYHQSISPGRGQKRICLKPITSRKSRPPSETQYTCSGTTPSGANTTSKKYQRIWRRYLNSTPGGAGR